MTDKIEKLSMTATHIIFISDIHFGRHVNAEEWQENMRNYFYGYFIPYLRQIKASLSENEKLVCVNLGDTYQDRKAIDINVNNLAIDVCEDIAKEVEFYILNGNHDLAKKTNEGNSSLRSLEYVPNVKLITVPTLLTIKAGKSNVKIIAIPYLGDCQKETEYLVEYSSKTKYALMHTELTSMVYDNKRPITAGANPDIFKGRVFSGHIHRRQESKNAIYVGSPYHLDKGDTGNTKGLYLLNLQDNTLSFKENDFSPVYQTLSIEDYDKMDEPSRMKLMSNNYNTIEIQEEDVPKYKKKYDLYNLGAGYNVKMAKPSIIKKHQTIAAEIDNDYNEKSLSELLVESIHQLEIDEDAMARLESMSESYLSEAQAKCI